MKKFLKTFYFIFSHLLVIGSLAGFPFLINGIIDGPWGFIIYAFTGKELFRYLKSIGKTNP